MTEENKEENKPTAMIVETAIANISISPEIIETSNFQNILNIIPDQVKKADDLLKAYRDNPDTFLETIDEDTIDQELKEMAEVSGFVKTIEASKSSVKSYLNGVRDTIMKNLDDRLTSASFHLLTKAQADIKQLKTDIESDKRARRWDELKGTFQSNINRYPLLQEYTPELTDFSRFKALFPKMVSGAKTRKIQKADHTNINNIIYEWHTAVQLITENSWGLQYSDSNDLIRQFVKQPSVNLVQQVGRQLQLNAIEREKTRLENEERERINREKAAIAQQEREAKMIALQQQAELAAKTRNEEAQRQALQQKQQIEEEAKKAQEQERLRQLEYGSFGQSYPPIFRESFPLFIRYLFDNPKYSNIHNNDQTKMAVIYQMMVQVTNTESVVYKETNNDPTKLLTLIRYVLDL